MNDTAPRSLLARALPIFLIALVSTGISWLCVGNSLGLFFAPIFFCCLLIPPWVKTAPTTGILILLIVTAVDGVGAIWLCAIWPAKVSFASGLGCYLILLAFCVALGGLTRAIRNSAIATAVSLAWLTWPVWLSPVFTRPIGTTLANTLTPVHPLLAMNGLVQNLGIWSQQPLAYRLTSLGQDVPYVLPGILPTILLHLMIGLTLMMIPTRIKR